MLRSPVQEDRRPLHAGREDHRPKRWRPLATVAKVSLSKRVRKALTDKGLAAAMDECARELLPSQAC